MFLTCVLVHHAMAVNADSCNFCSHTDQYAVQVDTWHLFRIVKPLLVLGADCPRMDDIFK